MSHSGPSRTLRDPRFMSAVEVLSGLDMLIQRFSECDPNVWSGRALQEISSI